MTILYNKVVNTPVVFDIKWDPYFNGEFWIDKDSALKYSDRIELFYNDNIITVNENNINELFPNSSTTLKLAGIVLLSTTLKVNQGKTFKLKCGQSNEIIEDQISESLWIKRNKITDCESNIQIIKRWYNQNNINSKLLYNLSTFRVEFDDNENVTKKIVINIIGKQDDSLNTLAIINFDNHQELTDDNEKLLLKTSPDLDGPDFDVQIKTIIDSNFIND